MQSLNYLTLDEDVHQVLRFGVDGTHNAACKGLQRQGQAVKQHFERGNLFSMNLSIAPLSSRELEVAFT